MAAALSQSRHVGLRQGALRDKTVETQMENQDKNRPRGWLTAVHPLWWSALAVSVGLALGVGVFTFGYAQGASYMTNDPNACANCHVMREQYAGWMKSSHGNVAVCNDCHSPAGFIPKYYTKARNGFFHSLAFTTGEFPDHIRINAFNYSVTKNACVKCHQPIVSAMEGVHQEGVDCIQCHHQVGHQ